MIDTLAVAYAEIGDFNSAVQYASQALAVKESRPTAQNFFNSTLRCFNSASQFTCNLQTRAVVHGHDYREPYSVYAYECIASFRFYLRQLKLPLRSA